MNVDLGKLSPAPWTVDHLEQASTSVLWSTNRNGACMLVQLGEEGRSPAHRRTNAEFVALSRNAFEVMMRRGWTVLKIGDRWEPHDALGRYFVRHDASVITAADPFTALVEADRWYREHVEKEAVS